jgi:hypothetical protein
MGENTIGLARCNNTECPKKDECSRYTELKSDVFIEFVNICKEANQFRWIDLK